MELLQAHGDEHDRWRTGRRATVHRIAASPPHGMYSCTQCSNFIMFDSRSQNSNTDTASTGDREVLVLRDHAVHVRHGRGMLLRKG